MKNIYTKPSVERLNILNKYLLCVSGSFQRDVEIKKYGCPIKKGVYCPDYDKKMYEYELAIEHLAETKQDFTFYQGSDEDHCPRKSCLIYQEWKNLQKTR